MRKRTLLANNIDVEIPVADAVACDVVFYNPKEDRLVIRREQKHWKKNETPIGVVVIPASHGVLKEGSGVINQCGVVSIVPMNCDTPDTGGTSEQTIYWGGKGTDIIDKSDGIGRYDSISDGLTNYQRVACDTISGTNRTTGLDRTAYLPRQGSIGAKPTFYSDSTQAASPYIGDDLMSGGYNKYYGTTEFDTGGEIKNVLADFKGIVNTKIITDLATAQSDWKTKGKAITNNSDAGYYPAACCCARFKTTGTKAFIDCSNEELKKGTGFWYLPAEGELGYILPRLFDINDTIGKLNKAYRVGVQLSWSTSFFSSSEYNYNYSWSVNNILGSVSSTSKSLSCRVRAFLRLNSEPEVVDMGLSVDWATCNLGANKPEEGGWFFQWGGTIPYNSDLTPVGGGFAINFGWNLNCPHWVSGTSPTDTKWSKYTGNDKYSSTGVADNKLILEPIDDAAHVHWGGDWRMPTEAEYNELLNACNTKWVTNYNGTGINGRLFTLKTDSTKTLFFPAVGSLKGVSYLEMNTYGYYWSSSPNTYSSHGYILSISDPYCYMTDHPRYFGHAVRAVKPKVPDKKVLPDGIYGFYCNTAFPTGPDDTNIQYLIECPICKVENGSIYLYGTSKPVAFDVSGARIGGSFVETYSPTFYSVSYRDSALNTMRNAILSCIKGLGYNGVMRMASGTGCLLEELYTDGFSKITILGDGTGGSDGPVKG